MMMTSILIMPRPLTKTDDFLVLAAVIHNKQFFLASKAQLVIEMPVYIHSTLIFFLLVLNYSYYISTVICIKLTLNVLVSIWLYHRFLNILWMYIMDLLTKCQNNVGSAMFIHVIHTVISNIIASYNITTLCWSWCMQNMSKHYRTCHRLMICLLRFHAITDIIHDILTKIFDSNYPIYSIM